MGPERVIGFDDYVKEVHASLEGSSDRETLERLGLSSGLTFFVRVDTKTGLLSFSKEKSPVELLYDKLVGVNYVPRSSVVEVPLGVSYILGDTGNVLDLHLGEIENPFSEDYNVSLGVFDSQLYYGPIREDYSLLDSWPSHVIRIGGFTREWGFPAMIRTSNRRFVDIS